MIKDMTKSLKEKMSNAAEYEKMVLDNYKLKDGLYIRLSVNKEPAINEDNHVIINNKKVADNESEVKQPELFKWFKSMDYYSSILNDDTNKAVDIKGKKIHSTNWMTLFIKRDIFPVIGKDPIDKKVLKDFIVKYYENLQGAEEKVLEVFLNSNYVDKKQAKKHKEEYVQRFFKEEVEHIRSQKRKEDLEVHRQYILEKFDKLVEVFSDFAKRNSFNGYIKVFFDIPAEVYKLENSIYLVPRIFNVNNFNLFTEDGVLGLPSNNITTNAKKPYLLLKSMQCDVPFRAEYKDVVASKNLFEWLVMQGKFREVKFDHNYKFDGTTAHNKNEAYFSVQLNKDAEIEDFDFVPFDLPRLEFKLENVLYLMETIKGDENKKERYLIESKTIKDHSELQQYFSEQFFNNKFLVYYKGTDPEIKTNLFTGQMRALYMLSRQALFDYFSKGINSSMKAVVEKLTRELILEQLRHTVQGNSLNRTAKAFNLRVSLLKYFEGEKYTMADKIKSNIDRLHDKLALKELVTCSSDEEFYFTAGQLAYYILSQSEAHKKTYGIFEPILNVKNSSQLKKRLKEIFAVYRHAISVDNIRFRNAMGMVMGYEADETVNDKMQELLLAGLMADNVFYKSNKEEKKDEK
jgi:CRISPR-associated protein Csh1